MVECPIPTEQEPQQRCLDQGYANPTVREAVRKHGAAPQFRGSGAEKLGTAGEKRSPALRWVGGAYLGLAVEMPVPAGA